MWHSNQYLFENRLGLRSKRSYRFPPSYHKLLHSKVYAEVLDPEFHFWSEIHFVDLNSCFHRLSFHLSWNEVTHTFFVLVLFVDVIVDCFQLDSLVVTKLTETTGSIVLHDLLPFFSRFYFHNLLPPSKPWLSQS